METTTTTDPGVPHCRVCGEPLKRPIYSPTRGWLCHNGGAHTSPGLKRWDLIYYTDWEIDGEPFDAETIRHLEMVIAKREVS